LIPETNESITKNIEQKESKNGKNLKEVYVLFIKYFFLITTVPIHVSKKHIQSYYDEFIFRINSSIFKDTYFTKQ
jgi:hypothetical protein